MWATTHALTEGECCREVVLPEGRSMLCMRRLILSQSARLRSLSSASTPSLAVSTGPTLDMSSTVSGGTFDAATEAQLQSLYLIRRKACLKSRARLPPEVALVQTWQSRPSASPPNCST